MTDLRKLLSEARTVNDTVLMALKNIFTHRKNEAQVTREIEAIERLITPHISRIDAALAEAVALHFLDRDNDGHWYVVQESKRKEWEKWLQIPSDDQASWEVPVFASPVGGAPNTIQFYIAAPADQWRRVEDGLPHTDHPMRHYDRTCPACNTALPEGE